MTPTESVIVEAFVFLGIIVSAIVHLSHPTGSDAAKRDEIVLKRHAIQILGILGGLVVALLWFGSR